MGTCLHIHICARTTTSVLAGEVTMPDSPWLIPTGNGTPSFAHSLLAERPSDIDQDMRRRMVVDGLGRSASTGDLPAQVLRALEQSSHLLVTTAGNPWRFASLLLDIARQRKTSRLARTTAVLVPQADRDDPLWQEIEHVGVEWRAVMADRLQRVPHAQAPHDRLLDTDVEWLVEGDWKPGVLRILGMHKSVRFVPELEPYVTRRRWLVDAPILATAIVGRDAYANTTSLTELPKAILSGPWRRQLLRALTAGLTHRDVVLDSTPLYATEQSVRWMHHRHEMDRLLVRLQRADLQWLLIEADVVLGAAARAAKAANGEKLPKPLAVTFEALHNLLVEPEQHADFGDVAKGSVILDADRDASAAHRYRRLLSGVLPAREAEGRVAEAEQRWARQRDHHRRPGS